MCRVVQQGSNQPGSFNHAIFIKQSAAPAKVLPIRFEWRSSPQLSSWGCAAKIGEAALGFSQFDLILQQVIEQCLEQYSSTKRFTNPLLALDAKNGGGYRYNSNTTHFVIIIYDLR